MLPIGTQEQNIMGVDETEAGGQFFHLEKASLITA